MNLNSKYFDRIRIRPEAADAAPEEAPRCEWAGCDHPGGYRAPKGRHREGEYHNYCLDHVREYNKSYNYFAGIRDDDIVVASPPKAGTTWMLAILVQLIHGAPETARVGKICRWIDFRLDQEGRMEAVEARIAHDMDPVLAASQRDVDEIVMPGELRLWIASVVEMAYQATGYRRIKNPRISAFHDLERLLS